LATTGVACEAFESEFQIDGQVHGRLSRHALDSTKPFVNELSG
jgi:hypothetical protein